MLGRHRGPQGDRQIIKDKKVVIGVVDHRTLQVERPEQVAALIREALKYIEPERLIRRLGHNNGLLHRCKIHAYSITSSARSRNASDSLRPSALATVRLMISSNLVGCSTGRSPAFAPRKILST